MKISAEVKQFSFCNLQYVPLFFRGLSFLFLLFYCPFLIIVEQFIIVIIQWGYVWFALQLHTVSVERWVERIPFWFDNGLRCDFEPEQGERIELIRLVLGSVSRTFLRVMNDSLRVWNELSKLPPSKRIPGGIRVDWILDWPSVRLVINNLVP